MNSHSAPGELGKNMIKDCNKKIHLDKINIASCTLLASNQISHSTDIMGGGRKQEVARKAFIGKIKGYTDHKPYKLKKSRGKKEKFIKQQQKGKPAWLSDARRVIIDNNNKIFDQTQCN